MDKYFEKARFFKTVMRDVPVNSEKEGLDRPASGLTANSLALSSDQGKRTKRVLARLR